MILYLVNIQMFEKILAKPVEQIILEKKQGKQSDYWQLPEAHLKPNQTSMIELFCENS